MTRTALLEIDFQPWIIELAHDPGALARAGSVRVHWATASRCTPLLAQDRPKPSIGEPSN
nr:hypothetical protein [uncultured Rhodococcus sp.]